MGILRQILVFVCGLPLTSLRKSIVSAWRGGCEPCQCFWGHLSAAAAGTEECSSGQISLLGGPGIAQISLPRRATAATRGLSRKSGFPLLSHICSWWLLVRYRIQFSGQPYRVVTIIPPILQRTKQSTKRLSNILKVMRISLASIWARIKWLCSPGSYHLLIHRRKGEPCYHVWPAMARKLC